VLDNDERKKAETSRKREGVIVYSWPEQGPKKRGAVQNTRENGEEGGGKI